MIGKVIQNYKIIDELGHGGMGIIYKAYDVKLDRYVAIKILKPQVTDNRRFIERFKIEAKNQAKLSHPNIVPVYGFIDQDGIQGIVMELIEGETVEQLLEKRIRLDLNESIRIIKQVLCAIGYAHSKGFLHRDLKPSNIIINRDNVAKIMDFGISKSIFDKGITNTGTNIGTLYYMSPEQIKGDDITLQSDIYSIGITLYEMLSGAVPFDYQNEYQVIEGHLKESAPELLGKVPGLPLTIQKIIEKSISKKPQSRFADCKDFYDELVKLENEMGKYNRPRVEKVDRSSKFYKAKAAVYTVLVVIAGLTLVYFSFNQVDGLWKSGINPFFKMKKNPELEQQISSNNKLKWKVLVSGVKNNLNSIYFINDSTGFCCGSEGTLLSTTNSGVEWKRILSPSERELVSICFNKPESGFLIDEYTVYRTRDYGKSWEKVKVDCSGKKLYKVKFIDKLNGFIIGSNGLILKTVDGGESWRQIESGTNNLLCDIVLDSNNGYCVGWSGEIIKTTDAGDHWKRLSPLTTNYLRRIKFADRENGFIIGGGGEIFKTTDAGANWAKVENSTSFGLYDMEYIDEKICLIVGGQGKALLSTDRGNSWNAAETNNFARLNEIFVTPQNTLFAVGANGTIVKL